ncbi:unnamed protein product [Lactuca saligna]|uniref:Uncharacterized protein n=1 Tax=Lactuca saligna TaxID=75948 RepID=A0AA35ZRJ9_LACSI|nr:unnamed protein product [Lactuca saligna]
MKSPKILNPSLFSYIRFDLFSNISSPSSPPLTHLHYLQTTPTLQDCTTTMSRRRGCTSISNDVLQPSLLITTPSVPTQIPRTAAPNLLLQRKQRSIILPLPVVPPPNHPRLKFLRTDSRRYVYVIRLEQGRNPMHRRARSLGRNPMGVQDLGKTCTSHR